MALVEFGPRTYLEVSQLAGLTDGFVRLADVVERQVDWLWPERIAHANVGVVAGDGGVGKSTLVQAIAAAITRGMALPGGVPGIPRNVVILSAEEDTSAVVRPRVRLMGADLTRITVLDIDGEPLTLPSGLDRLEARCREDDAGLLIVDTGPAFLDAGLKSNSEEDIRRFLAPLRAMAERLRMVVIVLVHLNKDSGRAAGHRIMGGAAWRNAPRQVLMVGGPPGEDPRETSERLVVVEKNNLGVYPPAVSFRLLPAPDDPSRAVVSWGQEIQGITAADIVGDPRSGEERSELEAAAEFLLVELGEGARPVKELESAAKDAGLAWATVKRAKDRVKAQSRKSTFGGGWEWWIEDSTKVLSPSGPHQDEHLDHLRQMPTSIAFPGALPSEDAHASHGGQIEHLRDQPQLLAEGDGWSVHVEPIGEGRR